MKPVDEVMSERAIVVICGRQDIGEDDRSGELVFLWQGSGRTHGVLARLARAHGGEHCVRAQRQNCPCDHRERSSYGAVACSGVLAGISRAGRLRGAMCRDWRSASHYGLRILVCGRDSGRLREKARWIKLCVQKCRGKGRADLVDLDKEAPPCKAFGRPSASFSQFVGVAPAWVRGVDPLLCIIGLPQRSKARLAYAPS